MRKEEEMEVQGGIVCSDAAATKAQRLSEVEAGMERLEGIIRGLCDELPSALENRLASVLRPEQSVPKAEESEQEILVPFANRIRVMSQCLERLRAECGAIVDRVEL
jgi:hypothetical protein